MSVCVWLCMYVCLACKIALSENWFILGTYWALYSFHWFPPSRSTGRQFWGRAHSRYSLRVPVHPHLVAANLPDRSHRHGIESTPLAVRADDGATAPLQINKIKMSYIAIEQSKVVEVGSGSGAQLGHKSNPIRGRCGNGRSLLWNFRFYRHFAA